MTKKRNAFICATCDGCEVEVVPNVRNRAAIVTRDCGALAGMVVLSDHDLDEMIEALQEIQALRDEDLPRMIAYLQTRLDEVTL